ncbi:MAG: hypothetical protein QW290_09305 [Sulfolobales archaeon]
MGFTARRRDRPRFLVEEPVSLTLRKIWMSKEDLAGVHVVSGSPTLTVEDVDANIYLNNKALRVVIPANSTVELVFGLFDIDLNRWIYGYILAEIPSDVMYRAGFAIVYNESATKIAPVFLLPYNADVYGYGPLSSINFLGFTYMGYVKMGVYIKLVNNTTDAKTVTIPLVAFAQQMDKSYYGLDARFTVSVTETSETVKVRYLDYITRSEKLDCGFYIIKVYYKSNGVNTLTVNIYVNNYLIATFSTTSSTEQAGLATLGIAYRKQTDIFDIQVRAYVNGGTGYITRLSFERLSQSRECAKYNKFATMTFTGTANTTTTHSILTGIKHFNVRKIVITTDANALNAYLYYSGQISESIGPSTTLTLDGGGGYIFRDLGYLQLKMTSGTTAGVVTVTVYYDETLALLL